LWRCHSIGQEVSRNLASHLPVAAISDVAFDIPFAKADEPPWYFSVERLCDVRDQIDLLWRQLEPIRME
jgi:hypothetical protein